MGVPAPACKGAKGRVVELSLGQQLAPHLPFLRRYARALTGSQQHGDNYVRATLQAIVDAPDEFPSELDPRLGLYKTFQAIFSSTDLGGDDEVAQSDFEHVGNARLKTLHSQARQALLLTAMEGFAPEDAAQLLDVSTDEVRSLVDDALTEIERQTRTSVLIIEDEPMIAMDLEAIGRELGHSVTGDAVTRDEAVASAAESRPGQVLADIQLADDS